MTIAQMDDYGSSESTGNNNSILKHEGPFRIKSTSQSLDELISRYKVTLDLLSK